MSRTNKKTGKAVSVLIFAAVVYLLVQTGFADALWEEAPVITRHKIGAEGRPLEYTAETGRIAIRDVETGEPHGYMFYIAYRVPSPGEPRPVTFVWNGGPGAASTLLHFYVVGPKRIEGGRLIDNAETWLTESDLVFVDPIGCGFSRPAKPEYGKEFYGTVGDMESVAEFIRCWRLLHDADDLPFVMAGESWGAPRATSAAYSLEKRGLHVGGLILISGGSGLHTEYCPRELRSALFVVDLARTAFYHGKLSPDLGEDFEAVRIKVETWARETYAPALAGVDSLSENERDDLIDQISRFTGLPAAKIDRKSLLVTPRQFRTGLLEDEGRVLNVFDMRRASKPGEGASDENSEVKAILRYLRRDLGYRTDLPYIGLVNWDQGFAPSGEYPKGVGARWNWATEKVTPEELKAAMAAAMKSGSGPPRIGAPLPATEEALALNPDIKVLVVTGFYDSYATCTANEETERRLPPALRESIRFKSYVGGHMMYLDPPSRLELSRDVKNFLSGIR